MTAAAPEVAWGRLVLVGCSRQKTPTTVAVPALELYRGGAVPRLRELAGASAERRSRVRILSAEHGIVTADTLLLPYDRPLDPVRARELRPNVARWLERDIQAGRVREVLVVAEPLYLVLVADLLALPAVRVFWVPDPDSGWAQAEAVLSGWGWR